MSYNYNNGEVVYVKDRDPRELNVVERIKNESKMKAALPRLNEEPVCMSTLQRQLERTADILTESTELILKSDSGKKFVVTVADDGSMQSAPAITCIEDLSAAIAKGGVIVLTENCRISEQVIIPEGVDVTLRLRGCNMILDYAENYAFVAKGNLTIEGEGNISVTGYGFSTSFSKPGSITVNGGTFRAVDCDYLFGCFGGSITINDGTFNGEYCVVNNFSDYYKKEGLVTINGGTLSAEYPVLGAEHEVIINGGELIKI